MCYLRTVGLLERGLLPNVHLELINLAVSFKVESCGFRYALALFLFLDSYTNIAGRV